MVIFAGPEVSERHARRNLSSRDAPFDDPSRWKRKAPGAAFGVEDGMGLLTNAEGLSSGCVCAGVRVVRVPGEKVKGRRNSRTR